MDITLNRFDLQDILHQAKYFGVWQHMAADVARRALEPDQTDYLVEFFGREAGHRARLALDCRDRLEQLLQRASLAPEVARQVAHAA